MEIHLEGRIRKSRAIGAIAILAGAAFGQPEAKPSFEIADVHASAPSLTPGMRGPLRQGVRWELKNGTLSELVAFAYGVDPDKVLGGPSWLEFDRFDVIAKAAPNTSAEALKAMLISLLADRFKLVAHSGTRPFPGFALSASSNLKFKESGGSRQPGCVVRMNRPTPGPDAGAPPLHLTLVASCHNAGIDAFAHFIRGILPAGNHSSGIIDKTELKGKYDLEFQFSPADPPAATEVAIEKQLGLKLEPVQIPSPVILVDSANRKPTPNAPDIATAFPPLPDEFEVASLKPSSPLPLDGGRGGRNGAGAYQGNRLTRMNVTLAQLINTAWNIYNADLIVGLPKFADTEHYDLIATVPKVMATSEGGSRDQIDLDLYRPMYQKLLIDRFQMKVHFENRPANTWVLSAAKPRLLPADPANRTKCAEGTQPGEKDPRQGNPALNRLVSCRNVTMAEFAALLPSVAPANQTSIVRDETGLAGSWDVSLAFSGFGFDLGSGMTAMRAGDGAGQNAASDPGGAVSLRDALKKLGLKLELQKRPTPVLVIDHIEAKPTDN